MPLFQDREVDKANEMLLTVQGIPKHFEKGSENFFILGQTKNTWEPFYPRKKLRGSSCE